MVRITAKFTKTKEGRTTFLSKEAGAMIFSQLRKINDDDLVWELIQIQGLQE